MYRKAEFRKVEHEGIINNVRGERNAESERR